MQQIKESDWKALRRLQPIAIDRFCRRVLTDAQSTCSNTAATAHERYGTLYELMEDRNKTMANIFDDLRRSNAMLRIALMRTTGLITDAEFAEFSEELRETIAAFHNIWPTE